MARNSDGWKIEPNCCHCHVETCNCFKWQLYLDGQRVGGSDNKQELEALRATIEAREAKNAGNCSQQI
jgi:hypothetical protein